MRYSGIQPQYFPRLHYFARILNADIFLIRDDVKFVAKHKYPDGKTGWSYQVHTPIKTGAGIYYLRVPVDHKSKKNCIAHVVPAYHHEWPDSNVRTIYHDYHKTPNFSRLFPDIEALLAKKYQSIASLNIKTILWGLSRLLGDQTPVGDMTIDSTCEMLSKKKEIRLKSIRRGIEFDLPKTSTLSATEKILKYCKMVGATEDYCGGTSVAAYLDKKLMLKNNISITVQNWNCLEYHQQFVAKQGFAGNLSIIDLLMNVSLQEARNILDC